MDREELSNKLYDRMAGEQAVFRDSLLKMSPSEILNHTYEYTVREDILILMDSMELKTAQIEALLESPCPLADVFKEFRNMETGYMDVLRECMENRANEVLQARREASRAVPLYQHDSRYAREHNELDVFRASYRANIACKEAIEAAIREGFDGMRLAPDAAKDVLAEFGPERVACVLAATLRDMEYDERFSRDNVAWSKTIPMYDDQDRRLNYCVRSHPAKLDDFIAVARKEIAQMAEKESQRRPSIRDRLAAKPVQGGKPSEKAAHSGRDGR